MIFAEKAIPDKNPPCPATPPPRRLSPCPALSHPAKRRRSHEQRFGAPARRAAFGFAECGRRRLSPPPHASPPLQGGLARRAGGSSKHKSAQKIRSPVKESGSISYLSALAALCCKLKQLRRAFQTLRVIGKNKSCGVNVNNRKHSSEIFYRSHYAAPFTQSLAYVVKFIVSA